MTVLRAALTILAILGVTTAAEASCTVSTTSVNFGSYDVFDSAPTDSTGSITLRCNGSARHVRVEISRGGAPSVAVRFMNKGFEPLFYNLYQDASRTTIWGDGTGGSDYYVGDPPNNRDLTLTVFGRIHAGQDVSAGSYQDTVTVTVQY